MAKDPQVKDNTAFPFYGELGTINLNSLTSEQYGIYRQSESGNVYSGLNYPADSPGSLLVLPTRGDGCVQEYRTYDTNALFRRHYYLATFMWVWSSWCVEYNSDNPSPARNTGTPLPVGALMLWPSDIPPVGWLLCDGSSFNCEEFPRLALIYPEKKLPNLYGPEHANTLLRYITKAE